MVLRIPGRPLGDRHQHRVTARPSDAILEGRVYSSASVFARFLTALFLCLATLSAALPPARAQAPADLSGYDLFVPENKRSPADGPDTVYVPAVIHPETEVSFSFEGEPLRRVLRAFAEKTGYRFGIAKGFDGTVDLTVSRMKWTEALGRALEQLPLIVHTNGDLLLLDVDPNARRSLSGNIGVVLLFGASLLLAGLVGLFAWHKFNEFRRPKSRPTNW